MGCENEFIFMASVFVGFSKKFPVVFTFEFLQTIYKCSFLWRSL
jgi:hypothetical protein